MSEAHSERASALTTYAFNPISSSKFANTDYSQTWLVKGLLVAGQPAIVGGPKKSLKTSIVTDLVLSLGTGQPFLGCFSVPKPIRVAFISGESGEATLQETARRVAHAKGVCLADADCLWGFDLPSMANVAHVETLCRGLREQQVEVLIIDPVYLCLLSGQEAAGIEASNVFQMGSLLRSITRACKEAGCTLILIHHTKKNLASPHEPPELEDLAYAGFQEFARQWWLLGRRETYEPGSGVHKLWFSVGGSVGHGGCWAVDVNEGTTDENFCGREWKLSVMTKEKATAAKVDDREEKKAQKKQLTVEANAKKILSKFNGIANPEGVAGVQSLRDETLLGSQAMRQAVAMLVREKMLEETTMVSYSGKNLKTETTVKALRRLQPATDRTERIDRSIADLSGHPVS